jgi:hypothetical protein
VSQAAQGAGERDTVPGQGRLMLTTVRSHDQFNTTIYSDDDRYRGLKGLRTVVFMNEADMADRGLAEFGIADYSTQSGQPVTKHLPVEITPAETTAEALERERKSMRLSGTIAAFSVQPPANVVPERAQMAATLGFHIILACVGIALPSIVLLAEFTGLRRQDETALLLARGLRPAHPVAGDRPRPRRCSCCAPYRR